MIQAITLLFVAATASTAMPIVNLWNAPASPNAGPAPLVVKRAETPAQIAQGSNYFFQSLSLESHCNHGEIGCVNGDMFARCSPEGNWELSPCPTNTICSAVPSTLMVAQIDVQCITQEQAQTAINEAGGEGNISQDFGITNAPVYALVDPSTLPSTTEAPTPTESEQPEDPNSTCIPDDEGGDDDEEGEVPSFTASLGEPVPTEIPTESAPVDPAATCTEEPEAVVTETITLILVPNPTVSGAFETSTLTGELPTATEFTEVPAETETASVSEVVTATSEAASVEPTETCSYEDEEPATEAPAETTSTEEAIQTTSASVPAEEQPASPTTLTIAPGATSVPVNAGTPPPSSSVDVNPLGNHFIPAAAPSQSPGVVRKRMEKKVKRS